ncbi:Tetrahydromethanopterin S-methyltransferase subunit F [Methanocaldococcus lauensis]|uniref:Tetrahydromethanopterin S-methyltransferase subunit F n=1 Tax=Methanocaldococcus lauensis TaxID=2546128 RepID=A0A8D6SZ28_9EURY|nr:tetrahydromethanopterin S-methyltransferase subunit F [Methanocaldococcus lauensis]CAB3287700.1 Tetrahydromethanopterin S-methyltransferase subunit F [Methanocaldococcus lauensis]CAB3290177.1 Tetrahydromethanopterin S-methyltransferase subunit F [Methanocaldococcus lauensis]
MEIEGIPTVVKPNLEHCDKHLEDLEYKVGLITRDIGLASGIYTKSTTGVIIGAVGAIVLVGIPIILKAIIG